MLLLYQRKGALLVWHGL